MNPSRKLIGALFGLIFLLAAFLIGQRTARPTALIFTSEDETALAGNSLINRFNQVTEHITTGPLLTKLSNDNGAFLQVTADGRELLYYLPASGEIRAITLTGLTDTDPARSALVAEIKPGLAALTWSASGQELIGTLGKENFHYHLPTGTVSQLPAFVTTPVFSGKTTNPVKIAYLHTSPANGQLNIATADPTVKFFKPVLATHQDNWKLRWLNGQTLAVSTQLTPTSGHYLFRLDLATGSLTRILENKNHLTVAWSPSGQQAVYSYADPYGETGLFLLTPAQTNPTALAGLTGSAENCIWRDEQRLYCFQADRLVEIKFTPTGFSTRSVLTDPALDKSVPSELVMGGPQRNYLIFKKPPGKLYLINLDR